VLGRIHSQNHGKSEVADVLENEPLSRAIGLVILERIPDVVIPGEGPEPKLLIEIGGGFVAKLLINRVRILVGLI
jgi:hypothetical protein